MPLANDLLEQAAHLAQRERVGPPRQASLRRSVSAAYYALFHLLSNAAAVACAPSEPANLRFRVQRALQHQGMKDVCEQVVRSFSEPYRSLLLPLTSHSPELQNVAQAFIDLQQARHTADYDTQERHFRTDALRLVQQAAEAFAAWEQIRATPETNIFLAALFFSKHWKR